MRDFLNFQAQRFARSTHFQAQKFAKALSYSVFDTVYPEGCHHDVRDWLKALMYYNIFNVSVCIASEVGGAGLGAAVGGMIQGNPDCLAQKQIEQRFPVAAFFTGAANALACIAQNKVISNLLSLVVGPNIAFVSTIFVMPLVCRSFMCAIEINVVECLENYYAQQREAAVPRTSATR